MLLKVEVKVSMLPAIVMHVKVEVVIIVHLFPLIALVTIMHLLVEVEVETTTLVAATSW